MTTVRHLPCAACPYRLDAPSGLWDASEYAKLPPYDAPTGEQPAAPFMCHTNEDSFCAGWASVTNARAGCEPLALRLQVAMARAPSSVLGYQCPDSVPLHASGAEAAAHGLRDLDAPGPTALKAQRNLCRLPRLR